MRPHAPDLILADYNLPNGMDGLRVVLETDGRTVENFVTCDAFLEAYRPGREGCVLVDGYLPGMDMVLAGHHSKNIAADLSLSQAQCASLGCDLIRISNCHAVHAPRTTDAQAEPSRQKRVEVPWRAIGLRS